MAYQQVSGTAANTVEFHDILKEFLVTTVGWTLHDDQSAASTPYFVFFSPGENGLEDIYLWYSQSGSSNRLAARAYFYWDAATQTGVKAAYSTAYSYIKTHDSDPFLFWIFASLDHLFIVTKLVTTYYGHYSGLIRRYWSDRIALTQADVSAGSQVTVPVNDASFFETGFFYFLKDNANISKVQIEAVDDQATPQIVTLFSLDQNYQAGSKLGEDPQPVVCGRYDSPGGFYATTHANGYSSATGQTGLFDFAAGGHRNAAASDKRQGLITLFPFFAGHSNSNYNELRGEAIGVYAMGSGAADSEDVVEVGEESFRVFYLSEAGWCAVKEAGNGG